MNLEVADNLQQNSSRELGQGRTKGGLNEVFRQHPLWHSLAILPQLMRKLLWQSLRRLGSVNDYILDQICSAIQ